MKIIEQSAKLMFVTPHAYELIEAAGRTCYKSEGKATPGSAAPFCASLIKRGHLSVLEHGTATFRFVCDRGVTHELVRHRLASYSQESTRYCNYGSMAGEIQVIQPPALTDVKIRVWGKAMLEAEAAYLALIASGVSPQIARSVLPTCLKTEIVVTANFREWLKIIELRTSEKAHPQIRDLITMAAHVLIQEYPAIFSPALNGGTNHGA
jgi:thymidylate synthase (FAD)